MLIAGRRDPIQGLIPNAATTIGQFKLTADNLESQMATNHIGSFLLTKLLTPKILAARTEHYTPRVAFVSSVGHSMTDFDTLARPDATGYVPKDAYNQCKAANVLCAIELSKRSEWQINGLSCFLFL
jgi:NAD(P)-dependent dehydrogenase (short-subunit alcohol dehydrogenase family)